MSPEHPFNPGLTGDDEAALRDSVLPVYNDTPPSATAYQALVHQYGQVLFGNLNVVSNIDSGSYAGQWRGLSERLVWAQAQRNRAVD